MSEESKLEYNPSLSPKPAEEQPVNLGDSDDLVRGYVFEKDGVKPFWLELPK